MAMKPPPRRKPIPQQMMMPVPPKGPPGRQRGPSEPATPVSPGAMKALIAVGVVFALLVLVAMFRSPAPAPNAADAGEPFKAQLICGDGTQRKTLESSEFATVTLPSEVASRDLLVFGATLRNVITLGEGGASLRFSDNAQAGIDDLRKSQTTQRVKLNLVGGRVWAVSTPSTEFVITSKKAAVKGAGDAVFEVSQLVDEKAYAVTTVRVFKGSVELTGQTKDSDKITISQGQAVKVNDDKVFPPEPFDTAKGDDWEVWNLAYTPGSDLMPKGQAAAAAPAKGGGRMTPGQMTAPMPPGGMPGAMPGAMPGMPQRPMPGMPGQPMPGMAGPGPGGPPGAAPGRAGMPMPYPGGQMRTTTVVNPPAYPPGQVPVMNQQRPPMGAPQGPPGGVPGGPAAGAPGAPAAQGQQGPKLEAPVYAKGGAPGAGAQAPQGPQQGGNQQGPPPGGNQQGPGAAPQPPAGQPGMAGQGQNTQAPPGYNSQPGGGVATPPNPLNAPERQSAPPGYETFPTR